MHCKKIKSFFFFNSLKNKIEHKVKFNTIADLIFGGEGAQPKNAVLRLKVDCHAGRNEVGGEHRHPDPEVGEHAVTELTRRPPHDLLTHPKPRTAQFAAYNKAEGYLAAGEGGTVAASPAG